MAPADQSERVRYYLVVVRRNAAEVFFTLSELGLSLPSVGVMPNRRIAPQLTEELKNRWRLQSYCLFVSGFGAANSDAQVERYAVLESMEVNGEAPEGTRWVQRTLCTARAASRLAHSELLGEALGQLDSHVRESITMPFGRPGWLRELFTWTQEHLSIVGLQLTGNFTQWNGSPTFSLIRLETNGRAAWFKATGEPNLHELPITLCLAQLFPEYLPPILAVHRAWNGWLSQEVSDTTPGQSVGLLEWEKTARSLAELQITSLGKCGMLIDGQCKDLRIRTLTDMVPLFCARAAELMAQQQKQSPPPLTGNELDFLARRLREALLLLEDLGLPDTLGHLDFNPGNIVVCPARCMFLDWAEACVTNPLVTFEYLCEHVRRTFARDSTALPRVSVAYLRPWTSLLSPTQLAKALAVSPLIAVFTYALALGGLNTLEPRRSPAHLGYLRSLTRRMHVEAIRQADARSAAEWSSHSFKQLVPLRTLL